MLYAEIVDGVEVFFLFLFFVLRGSLRRGDGVFWRLRMGRFDGLDSLTFFRKHRADVGEVVHGEEIDEHFAPLVLLFDADACTHALRELALTQQKLGRQIGLADALDGNAASGLLRIAHGEALRDDFLEEDFLLFRPVHEHKERAGVSFGNLARRECVAHFLREQQNAECVGNVFAAFTHALADLYVFEPEFFCKPFERERPVERIEVFPLKILDNSEFELHPVRILARADDGGYLQEASELRRAQSTLSRDELVLDINPLFGAFDFLARDGKRLQNAVLPYGFRQRKQRRFVEVFARLKRVRFYALDLYPKDRVALVLTLHGKSISLPHL